jgi:hypothetical protein
MMIELVQHCEPLLQRGSHRHRVVVDWSEGAAPCTVTVLLPATAGTPRMENGDEHLALEVIEQALSWKVVRDRVCQ